MLNLVYNFYVHKISFFFLFPPILADFKVGQNIAQYLHSIEAKVDWESIIESWYSEVVNWTAEDTPKFK